jgi:hypothetical protein
MSTLTLKNAINLFDRIFKNDFKWFHISSVIRTDCLGQMDHSVSVEQVKPI